MTQILRINTSLNAERGVSNQLMDALIGQLLQRHPQAEVVERDLAREAIPHLDGERFTAYGTPADQRTQRQSELTTYSDELVAELIASDVLVIGLPMYNFGVPSTLKAWIDHVARPRMTFRYTDTNPVGLLADKKIYLVTTRGGYYREDPKDTEIPFIKTFFAFLGLTDVEVIYAEGLNINAESKQQGIAAAHQQINSLAASAA